MTVCIVDTTILCELLNVPGKASHPDLCSEQFGQRMQAREHFLLALPVVLETSNHIAHSPGGSRRRKIAGLLREMVGKALSGNSPFVPTPFPTKEQVADWMQEFPDHVMKGIGLTDQSLIALWNAQRELNPHRRVYIWSLDADLSGYDTDPT